MKKTLGIIRDVSGKGLRIGIVVSRFNLPVTKKLLDGAERVLRKAGVREVKVLWVPGAFEIPIVLSRMARSKKFDGLIALGAVVRGGTPHFDYVAGETARGVMEVSLKEGVPVAFGVLTTDTMRQAIDRAGGRHGNKGEEAALVAIEMARLVKSGKST